MFKKKPFKRKYRQSDNFIGFHRVYLSSFGHKPSEKGCAALLGKNLSGARIVVFEIDLSESVPGQTAFGVEVNGKRVGAAFGSDAYPLFVNNQIEAVHVLIETENILAKKKGLFGREKEVTTVRARSVMYVKVKS